MVQLFPKNSKITYIAFDKENSRGKFCRGIQLVHKDFSSCKHNCQKHDIFIYKNVYTKISELDQSLTNWSTTQQELHELIVKISIYPRI